MRISSARVKGFGPFGDVAIDFDALPESAKLIALCGENGVGKSTLVDLLVDGAAWREWPRRGGMKIDHVANDRDSLLEVTHEIGGKSYLIRHLVDGVSGKGESAVYLDGEALTKSGKLTEFYSFAKENFPAKSVVHSSIVSHPAYGSFVTMKATERKDVILLALGVEGIEKLAAAARKEIDKTSLECTQKRDAATIALNAANVDESTGAVNLAETRLKIAARHVSEAQSTLDVAKQLAGDSALARQRYEEQVAARTVIEDRLFMAEQDLRNAAEKLTRNNPSAAELELGVTNGAHDSAKVALSNAEAVASSLRTKREAANRQSEDRLRVQLELDRATAAKVDIEKRLANIRAVLDKGEKIRGAVTRSKELTDTVTRLELDSANTTTELKRLGSEIAGYDADRKRHSDTAVEAERRIVRANKTLTTANQVRAAAATLEVGRETVVACKEHVESAELELETLKKKQLSAKDVRIDGMREALSEVATSTTDDAEELRELANGSISEDLALINESDELPGIIESAEGEVALFREGLRTAEEKLHSAEFLATQLPLMESAERDLTEATESLNVALLAAEEAERKASALADGRARLAKSGLVSVELARGAKKQLAELADLVALADKLTAAEGLREERIAQLTTATAEVDRLTEELEALPEPPPVPSDPDLAGLRAAVDKASAAALAAVQRLAAVRATREHLEPQIERLRAEVASLSEQLAATPVPVPPEASPDVDGLASELAARQAEHTQAAKDLGAAQAALEAAQRAEFEAAALREALALAEVELADWTRLAADIGRKGLQAALVDSAGPELTRATNDLLHSCFGPRWTVTYETQRVNGNGGTSEGYDIRIVDTERGRDGVVEDLSDGERTIIGEAASLALTELACKRAGFDNPTLIRDESGAALSPEKRPMWVAMLRRAALHVNADRVIVISHSEDVQELCDVRMRVADGNVTVES